ncbi:MAG TPA: transposase [Gaiellaceae bacterium]
MPRPPRIAIPGATYHVFARGNRKASIVEDDVDRTALLRLVNDVFVARRWCCLAYCLMTNHYHVLVETPADDLSAGMHALNGRYARAFNRRHGWKGHLFEKRFGCIAAESDFHLLELCRYVVLNPVRVGLCSDPADWRWSSFGASAGFSAPEPFLDVHRLLSLFGGDAARGRVAYRRFVENGMEAAKSA